MIRTQPKIDAFLVRPEGLLERFPRGDVELAAIISELVGASYRTTLKPTVKLIDRANGSQRLSIGQGLAAAVRLCQGKDATMIESVNQAIAGRREQEFLNGYYPLASAQANQPPAAPREPPRRSLLTGSDPFKIAPLTNPLSPLR